MRLRRFLKDCYRAATFPHRITESRGVFSTADEAMASAPTDKPLGYDHAAVARYYREELDLVLKEYEYPNLFHLARILQKLKGRPRILDFGGNVGVHYLGYRRYLDIDDVEWIVCDVPAITKVGVELCAAHRNVSFINDLSELPNREIDILLAAGSIEYCCSDFTEHFIVRGQLRPKNILLSQVMLYDGPPFVTLQNGGLSYYPQHVYNRDKFISSLELHGFSVVDEWLDCSGGLSIPFRPDCSIPMTTGICLESASPRPSSAKRKRKGP